MAPLYSSDRITVGKVQRQIKIVMSAAEVISVLGSPNIVTTDRERREEWVYDKVRTEHAYSRSEGGVYMLIIGAFQSQGKSCSTQKTLTIVVKF